MKYDGHNAPVIGIDLGTTYSSVAKWTGEEAEVYSPKGDRSIRSVVYYDDKNDKYIFGDTAFSSGILNPDNVAIGAKRLMDNKDTVINIGGKDHSPVDLSSLILKHIYCSVKDMFPEGIYNAQGVVVTVPYYFKAHQFMNTAEATKNAGLNLLGIIQEPIAAAFAYGLHHSGENVERQENIMVFDLGGGTFDITVFKIKEDKESILFDVIGIGGDDRLGGIDFDNAFMDYIIKKEGIDFESVTLDKFKKIGRQKLIDATTKAKETLSSTDSVYIAVPDVVPGQHIDSEYTRADFEESIKTYTDEIRSILKETLIVGGINPDDIEKVIKVGGSGKIPIMDEIIADQIGANKIYSDIDPSLCVAEGAAIYAAYLNDNLNLNKKIDIKTATAHSLGIEDANGEFIVLIHQNHKTPARKTLTFTTDKDNQEEIDVEVYQGSSKVAKENSHVGTVRVTGLKPTKKYELEIKITFDINQEQEVTVVIEEALSGINKKETLKLI